MQTNFTDKQLQDPHVAASEKILRKCVHCGFCTATCPTYLTLGDELDSPRGRIYLIKDMLENDKPAEKKIVKHIDRCLSCLACVTTCPSGVDYMHLVDHARGHIEKTYKRPLMDRFIRYLLTAILPYPGRFRVAVTLARIARPFAGILKSIEILKPMAAMLDLAPSALLKPNPTTNKSNAPKSEGQKGRVIVLKGCAQPVLNPRINEATAELLDRLNIEFVSVPNEGCCGALVHHMGKEDLALQSARRNIDAWWSEYENGGLDAIVITTSGCGTTVKDYGYLLRFDPDYAEKAKVVSSLTKDVTEYLVEIDLPNSTNGAGLKVAYHSACSLQHGQRVIDQPKNLLKNAGFTVLDIPEGHLCCGSAGTYNILQSEIADQLKNRKLANIAKIQPDIIAAGNIGCMTQISSGTDIPMFHTIELLNWATGGTPPQNLEKLLAIKSAETQ